MSTEFYATITSGDSSPRSLGYSKSELEAIETLLGKVHSESERWAIYEQDSRHASGAKCLEGEGAGPYQQDLQRLGINSTLGRCKSPGSETVTLWYVSARRLEVSS